MSDLHAAERERFEAWFVTGYHPQALRPMEAGCYLNSSAGMAWDAWQARAALSAPAAEPVPTWQPIETAPNDMLPHLFRVNGVAVEAFMDAIGQLLVVNERREWRAMRGKPTHWMPLPAAPQPKEPT